MTFRTRLLASTTLLGMAGLLSGPAQAGLLGAGATVQAFYYNGSLAGTPEGEIPVGGSTSDATSLAAAVDYQLGSADGSTIHVDDTQITITNALSGNAPFCVANTSGTSCADPFDGFVFRFTGENITGVSVNGGSDTDFLPVTGTFQSNDHLGLQLLDNNDIQVDVTGDAPDLNHRLVLDLQFQAPPPPPPQPPPPPPPPSPAPAPEPATMAILASALAGLTAVRRRRR